MKQIILIRHSEKESFEDEAKDTQLTEKGIMQSLEIKQYLKEIKYDAIYTSLYLRSIQTSKLINKGVNTFKSNAFNEYYVREDGVNLETVEAGTLRSMCKIYSLFEEHESIAIVSHRSINQTILRALLNIKYEDAKNYFNKFGEVQMLRYDWVIGDKNWFILDSFIPKQ